MGPPLWSSGQSVWLQIQTFRFRFPTLPHFVRTSESVTGTTQPREGIWGVAWMKKLWLRFREPWLTATRTSFADHATHRYQQHFAITWRTSGGRSVGSRATDFYCFSFIYQSGYCWSKVMIERVKEHQEKYNSEQEYKVDIAQETCTRSGN
jgi:hypothetical protein